MKVARQAPKRFLRTKIVRKIQHIDPHQWKKIFPSVAENYYFLKTLDESSFEQFDFYYVLVYDKKELVGAAPCFVMNYAIKKVFHNIFSLKALVCGIPMGQGHLGNTPSLDVVEAIEMRMERLACKIKAPLLAFKDFDNSYDEAFKILLAKDYLKIDSLPMTRQELDFKNFEEFLNKLSSATRYDFRRKLKKVTDVKIEFSAPKQLDDKTLDEAYELYLQAVEIHHRNFETVPKQFFKLIAQNMPQETQFFLWKLNGRLVAFSFCLVLNDLLLDYYLGFDYTPAHEYHLYFVKFKDMLEWCLKHKIKTYEFGATGYEPKRRLKFEMVPVYLYVKARPKILRPVIKLLSKVLKIENFDPILKQWKKSH